METFYIVVLSIAIGFLILLLTFFGILMSSKNSDVVFPPVSTQCPDKWKADGSLCIMNLSGGLNTGNIYTGGTNCLTSGTTAGTQVGSCKDITAQTATSRIPNSTFINRTYGWVNSTGASVAYSSLSGDLSLNFADSAWGEHGSSAICQQKKWANEFGISWSGVSNYTHC